MKKFKFQVTTYGEFEQITPTLSKIRCRLFYKGQNRNGSYITDEFAEKLLASLPYAPLKGIYDEEAGDFTDHGLSNDEGRIYGVVPENSEVEWVDHLDEDGVTRTYASCAVYIYTALYKEAQEIVGKSHSMEIYPPSIKGEWIFMNGKKLFKFTDGVFYGLQVLGDNVEPCFEGAAFFALYNNVLQKFEELERYTSKNSNGGNLNMELNFKVSDSQKFNAIWCLLNDRYNEENNWEITYAIQEIYDEYALVFNYEANRYERVKYTKDNENDTVELGEKTAVYFLDVTETEKNVIEKLRDTVGSYELIEENFEAGQNAINELSARDEQIKEYSTKISELESDIATLNTDKENVANDFSNAQATISSLTEENEALKNYKKAIDKARKLEVINSYANLLPASSIEEFTLKVDEYADETVLDKELAYELKNSNISVFAKAPRLIPLANDEEGSLAELLSKYKK